LTHPTGLFSEDYISAYGFGGAVPSNFYTPYNPLNSISSWVPDGLKLGSAPYF